MSAWVTIANAELGGAGSITFSSIASTYTDLVVMLAARGASSDAFQLRFNGSTANFSGRMLQGNGSSPNSFTRSDNFVGYVNPSTAVANSFGSAMIYIPDYSGSNTKLFYVEAVTADNSTFALQTIHAGLWSSTSAINEITLLCLDGSNFAQFSLATLYGITKGSDGIIEFN